MDDNSTDEMVTAMLDANQKREAERERQQQEKEKHEAERQHLQQVTSEQIDQLVKTLGTVIDEFNQRSSSGQISASRQGNRIRYSLPFQQTGITLEFFTVTPPLNLSRKNLGFVPVAGYLKGVKDTGRNFLWCRENKEDWQGKWIACRVSTRAALRQKPDRKPFGIVYGFENEKDLREIETSISMMHVYEVDFEEDVRKEFTQILLEAMKTG